MDASSRILTDYSILISGIDAILLVINSSYGKEKNCLPLAENSAYRFMKKVLTVVRKYCLPDREKSPYRMTVKSSYHPHI
jgi:hypothetical protein